MMIWFTGNEGFFRWEDRSQFRDCSSLEVNSLGSRKTVADTNQKAGEKLNGETDMLRVTESF